MNRDEYLRAADLFEELRSLPESALAVRLGSIAQTDPDLRSQVVRLLEAERQAGSDPFMQQPAMADVAKLLTEAARPLPEPGTIIGNYRLLTKLQAGGMGVVYQANDLRLQRRVAVKVLPTNWALGTPDAVQRFQREARAISQLNHPNVVYVFDAGFDQEHYYIAMELVDGKNLRQMLTHEPSRLDDAVILDILSQTGSALAAAHAAGIVHRDIKPENIMLRRDGLVKVLDFGLAKLPQKSATGFRDLSDLRTVPGQVAGTIQYLSPEQVLGKPADGRSDIFSLGVVAYELATKQRPFDGPTDGAVFDAIVNRIPVPPSAIRPSINPDLDATIVRALEKDPEFRFQTATDLRSACRRLTRGSGARVVVPPTTPKRSFGGRVWIAGYVLAFIAGALLVGYWKSSEVEPAPLLFRSFAQFTPLAPHLEFPVVSGDGSQVVYESTQDGNRDLLLQRVGGSTSINLTKDCSEDDSEPALSPDDSRIAFRSNRGSGGLFVMELTGENPRRVSGTGYFPTWSPTGSQIAYSTEDFSSPTSRGRKDSRIVILDLTTGAERQLETGDAIQPNWSPNGHRIAFWAMRFGGRRDIVTVAADGKSAPVAVTDDDALDWYPVWAPSGDRLYFLSDRGGTMGLWQVLIDERSGRTFGPPKPITLPATHVAGFSLAKKGQSLVFAGMTQKNRLESVDYDPVRRFAEHTASTVVSEAPVTTFSLSPDGAQIVSDTLGETREELWIINADGTSRRRLVAEGNRVRAPEWSPDGTNILFMSDRTGNYEIWAVRPDGSELRPLTAQAKLDMQRSVWMGNSEMILAGRRNSTPVFVDLRRKMPGVELTTAPGAEDARAFMVYSWSPANGGMALGTLPDSAYGYEIVLYHRAEKRIERSGVHGAGPTWVWRSADRFFVFSRGPECYLFDRVAKRETKLFSVAPAPIYRLHVHPNGRRIFYSKTIREVALWVARVD